MCPYVVQSDLLHAHSTKGQPKSVQRANVLALLPCSAGLTLAATCFAGVVQGLALLPGRLAAHLAICSVAQLCSKAAERDVSECHANGFLRNIARWYAAAGSPAAVSQQRPLPAHRSAERSGMQFETTPDIIWELSLGCTGDARAVTPCGVLTPAAERLGSCAAHSCEDNVAFAGSGGNPRHWCPHRSGSTPRCRCQDSCLHYSSGSCRCSRPRSSCPHCRFLRFGGGGDVGRYPKEGCLTQLGLQKQLKGGAAHLLRGRRSCSQFRSL